MAQAKNKTLAVSVLSLKSFDMYATCHSPATA